MSKADKNIAFQIKFVPRRLLFRETDTNVDVAQNRKKH